MTLVTSAGFNSFVDKGATLAGTNTTAFNVTAASDPKQSTGIVAGLGSTSCTDDGAGNLTGSYLKTGAGNNDWEIDAPGSSPYANTRYGYYMSQANRLMGPDSLAVAYYPQVQYIDFVKQNYSYIRLSGVQTISPLSVGTLFIQQAASTPGVAVVDLKPWGNFSAVPFACHGLGGTYWYAGGLYVADTTSATGKIAGVGFFDASMNPIIAGVNPNISTTKYSLTIGTGSGVSTVSITANAPFHLFEFWHNSGGIYFSVDQETPIHVTGTPPIGNVYLTAYSSATASIPATTDYFSNIFSCCWKVYQQH